MFSKPGGFGRVTKAEVLMYRVLSRCIRIERRLPLQCMGVLDGSPPMGVLGGSPPIRIVDFFIPSCKIFIEIDGAHHFGNAAIVEMDVRKMHAAFASQPRSIFVRVKDVDVLGPLLLSCDPREDVHRPFPVEWMTIIMSMCFRTAVQNACIFIESPKDSSYDAHKAACGVPWKSVSDTSVLGMPPCLERLMEQWREHLFSDAPQRALDEPDCGMFDEMTL